MKRTLVAIGVVIVLALVYFLRLDTSSAPTPQTKIDEGAVAVESEPTATPVAETPASAMDKYNSANPVQSGATPAPSKDVTAEDETPSNVRDYTVEDGVAVIDGDIVIGQPGSAGRAAAVGAITPWPTSQIPYFINDDVPDKQRVLNAITAYNRTAVRFVPYTNQRDVLVFQNAAGTCKSYMGRIGGKQPIFISPDCGPHEITHELMHALGFLHEQNRTDRDQYVRVNRENIDGAKILNFEKFPQDFMLLSGLSAFDPTSIMIYPTKMFSRNGEPTMTSLGAPIQPSDSLSVGDISRINQFYGSR